MKNIALRFTSFLCGVVKSAIPVVQPANGGRFEESNKNGLRKFHFLLINEVVGVRFSREILCLLPEISVTVNMQQDRDLFSDTHHVQR